jgi:hypothetical protein
MGAASAGRSVWKKKFRSCRSSGVAEWSWQKIFAENTALASISVVT